MPRRLRALLVEDNPVILEALQGTLAELSAVDVVGVATAEKEACEWMDSRVQACDVAIVDVFLTSGSGLGVLQHMKNYARPPERIVLTNYATEPIKERCKALGAAAVFDKSTEIHELLEWLATRVRH